MNRFTVPVVLFAVGAYAVAPAEGASCESLATILLPATTITSAQLVAAGAFVPPAPAGAATAQAFKTLPAFCRIAATLQPSSDSDIRIEVWMPATGWNGKFQGVGNGGFGGVISYAALASAVAGGYASASTNTGHTGPSAEFALGHPEKVIDFAYRAVHEMTVQAKAIISAHYSSAPAVSIWNGCSTGGRQALNEAFRYPADYDAIIAGASAVYWMQLQKARMAINQVVHRSAESYIPPEKYATLGQAALDACDTRDGVKDGVIDTPTECRFDPKVLECKGPDGPSCLTAAQVETARAIYAPVTHPVTRAAMFAPLLQRGSELLWGGTAGPEPQANAYEAFKYLVFKDAGWHWRRFNVATDFALADKTDNGLMDTTDPNLKPFFDRGGKLLMYHGWADQTVPSLNSVRYFDEVVKTVGSSAVGKSIQLYMVPGMNHCQGGPGTDTFDKMAAMEQWLATGSAPAQIKASHIAGGKVDRTRPLCPYGQTARWNGAGSTDDAANFACVVAETPMTGSR